MAWTTPATAVAGSILTAAFWNQQVRDLFALIKTSITDDGLGWIGRLLYAGGTIAASAPVADWSQTWNNALVAFKAFRLVITDAASDAASLVIEVLGGAAGTTPLFLLSKTGLGTFGGGVSADTISEKTAAAGVTVDGVLLKDGTLSGALLDYATSLCDGRLTLTSGAPVTDADVTAATTVYFTPNGRGNRIALFDGTNWRLLSFAELSIALGSDAANKNYDVFAYINAGAVAIERLVWTNDTTRATGLAAQDGVLVKSGDATRRYLGTYRTTATIGQTEDSATKRLVWNHQHRVRRYLVRLEGTDWNYTTSTWRQARASAANQVEVVVGVVGSALQLSVFAVAENSGTNANMAVGIGKDSTTDPSPLSTRSYPNSAGAGRTTPTHSTLNDTPAVGYHFYAWLERSTATGTTKWLGADTLGQSGIVGSIDA